MTPALARFGDVLAEPLRNGVYKPKQYHGRGAKVINMKELFAFERIDDQATDRVYLEPGELARAAVQPGDLLFARRSFVLEGAGKCSIIGEPSEVTTFESSMIRARLDTERAIPHFMYYLFASPLGRAAMASIATRTAVSGITGKSLQELMLPLPPRSIQRKIVAILSAYDDLIENNNQRIQLLEEMAQRIYREWFVDFRYPGHEDVSLVKSALGPIPEGWNVGTLADLVDINANSIRKPNFAEEIRYIDIASVTRGVVQEPKRMLLGEAPGRARRRVADGDIIWSTVRPNLRSHALLLSPGHDCVASTGFAVLSPRNASFAYVYAMTTSDEFVAYLTGRATGSAYPAVTPSVFQNTPAIILPENVIRAYAKIGEPLMRLASNLSFQAIGLSTSRDLLLPRLISGLIDVANLNIAMPEAIA